METSITLLWTLVAFVTMLTYMYGHPIRLEMDFENLAQTTTNGIHGNATCTDNCIFFFNKDSLENAKINLAKFLDMETPTGTKGMLLYVNLNTQDITLLPDDQKLLNQFKQWQWTHANMEWYLKLPIDLDFTTFHLSALYEMNIFLKLEANFRCCYINDTDVHAVSDLLWSELFVNTSDKLLCNRNFEEQQWKNGFYFGLTTWVGYDLLCTGSNNDINYKKKIDSLASIVMPIFCFFIALYHPLIYKVIENAHIKGHFENIKKAQNDETSASQTPNNPTERRRETDYFEGDSPFGFFRMTLKLFFIIKYESSTQISKFVPMLRLNILICLLYWFVLLIPMSIEYKYDPEELNDFPYIYKFGLPIFYFWEWKPLNIYAVQFTYVGILILIFFARIWSYIILSETKEEDVLFSLKYICRNDPASNTKQMSSTKKYEDFIENFLNISVYGKHLYCFKTLLSKEFWAGTKCCRCCKDRTSCSWSYFGLCFIRFVFNFVCLNFFMMAFPGILVICFVFSYRFRVCKDCKSCKQFICCKLCENCQSCTECACNGQKSCNDCLSCKECQCKVCTCSEDSTSCKQCKCCKTRSCCKDCRCCIDFTCNNCTCCIGCKSCKKCICERKCCKLCENCQSGAECACNCQISCNDCVSCKNCQCKVCTCSADCTSCKECTCCKNCSCCKDCKCCTDCKHCKKTTFTCCKHLTNWCKLKCTCKNGWKNWCKEIFVKPFYAVFYFLCLKHCNRINNWCKLKSTFQNCWKNWCKEIFVKPFYAVFYFLVHLAICFVLYLELSIVTFMVRSVMYILFIVITNYEHYTRIVIVALTCGGYIVWYILKFIGKYQQILELMLRVKEKLNNECSEITKIKVMTFISETHFNYVIDKCHLLREQVFFLVLKVIVTAMFFVVAITILLDSRLIDQTKQLNNVIELIVVIVTPHVFLKCLEKDTKVTIQEHKQDIVKYTKKYYEDEDNDETKQYNQEKLEKNRSPWSYYDV